MKKRTILYRRLRAFLGRPLLVKQTNIVSVDDIEYCDDPIYILGCHRSGTSLLRRMLNSHHSIACPPETQYLSYFFDMAVDEKAIAGLEGLMDKNDIKRELQKWAFKFHELFRISENKKRWADKTPEYVNYYNRIKVLSPINTQYIIIFRDPFDIVHSIYSRKWRLSDNYDDLLLNTIDYVKKTCELLLEIKEEPNVFSISYEKLAKNPEITTKMICEFLKENWDEAMVKPWLQKHNFGTEDPIARSLKKIELSSNNWLTFNDKEQELLQSELGAFRKYMGY